MLFGLMKGWIEKMGDHGSHGGRLIIYTITFVGRRNAVSALFSEHNFKIRHKNFQEVSRESTRI